MSPGAEDVLEFWFADALAGRAQAAARVDVWFGRSEGFDRECLERFGDLVDAAGRGKLESWLAEPRSALALVLLLDQFPRNIFRGNAEAFRRDSRARAMALRALANGAAQALHPLEASFLYLPLEHAEDRLLQDECVAGFEWLRHRATEDFAPFLASFADYARRHREIIRRFGRFPHRNAVLGRVSTPEEEQWLREGGETFGG